MDQSEAVFYACGVFINYIQLVNLRTDWQLSTGLWWLGGLMPQTFFPGSGVTWPSLLTILCGWCRTRLLTSRVTYLYIYIFHFNYILHPQLKSCLPRLLYMLSMCTGHTCWTRRVKLRNFHLCFARSVADVCIAVMSGPLCGECLLKCGGPLYHCGPADCSGRIHPCWSGFHASGYVMCRSDASFCL